MGAVCDSCGVSRLEVDVFAFTRAGAYTAMADVARAEGWRVTTSPDPFADVFMCKTCLGDERKTP